jgi:hypothetical protein
MMLILTLSISALKTLFVIDLSGGFTFVSEAKPAA